MGNVLGTEVTVSCANICWRDWSRGGVIIPQHANGFAPRKNMKKTLVAPKKKKVWLNPLIKCLPNLPCKSKWQKD